MDLLQFPGFSQDRKRYIVKIACESYPAAQDDITVRPLFPHPWADCFVHELLQCHVSSPARLCSISFSSVLISSRIFAASSKASFSINCCSSFFSSCNCFLTCKLPPFRLGI